MKVTKIEKWHDKDTCLRLAKYLDDNVKRLGKPNVEPFFNEREIDLASVDDEKIAEIMREASADVAGIISDEYGIEVYPEYTDLVLWRKGMDMNVHKDNDHTHFHHRTFSAVLYLTTSAGGATTFPTISEFVDPKAGTLVYYPSSLPHGVNTVSDNKRRTLAMWFTTVERMREQ